MSRRRGGGVPRSARRLSGGNTVVAPSAFLALALACAAGTGCGGVPWFLGAPLDGRPSIPARSRVVTVAEHRRFAEAAVAQGNHVGELAELEALAERDALRGDETRRLVELLLARAADWIALGRPIALVADLRKVIALAPQRRGGLSRALRASERAAGDQWLAMGQLARAEEEYRHAERDGASGMDFRFRAAWDAAVGDLEPATLVKAIAELPARTLAPFSEAYLNAGGGEAALLYRAWRAARTYGPSPLLRRIEALPSAAAFPEAWRREPGHALTGEAAPTDAPPGPPPTVAELQGGPSLARRLIPAARRFPELLAPGARSRQWVDDLIAEDPTSPDSFEIAALIEARAGRTDSAAQKLEELQFFSPDRADAAARVAMVWEEVGAWRRACAAWEQAARLGATDDERWCRFLDCAGRHPGASDLPSAERFVADRAPDLVCARSRSNAEVPGEPALEPEFSAPDPQPR